MNTKRQVVSAALAALLVMAPLAACSSNGTNSGAAEEEGNQENIANPFVDCESASEAAEVAGFGVTFPESVPGYSERMYQAIEGEMAQCFYSEGDKSVLIRKGLGDDDLSGDYNEYSQTVLASIGGIDVTERGDNDLVHVATWTKDGYSFAIDADEGLEPEVIEQLVAATM